ncbi:hypothetical protein [Bacillus sp. FJAT-22090]|uniref:hypothetical protein n=1 Tax=Bacillus sp. FJAT-22090 TaxID=1581038 RepID=UPI0011A2B859|nr:hypothetical protein [Bacillus sp. FJAT-22090]
MVTIQHNQYTSKHAHSQATHLNAHTRTNTSPCSFDSYDEATQHIMDHLLNQSNLFNALQLAHQINILNGFQAVSQYHFAEIKSYFRRKHISNIKTSHIQSQNNKNGNPQSKSSNFQREYKKAYMKLISN